MLSLEQVKRSANWHERAKNEWVYSCRHPRNGDWRIILGYVFQFASGVVWVVTPNRSMGKLWEQAEYEMGESLSAWAARRLVEMSWADDADVNEAVSCYSGVDL
jgi:hypothetical protein